MRILTFWGVFLIIYCYGIFKKADGSLQTDSEVTGLMGEMVSMKCTYVPSSENVKWYIIQWKKQVNGSQIQTIVTLQNNFLSDTAKPASWNSALDPNFRKRARTNIRQDKEGLSFALEIYSFSCDDKGLYSCEMTGDNSHVSFSRLVLQAKPLKPTIHNDVVIVEENSTCVLECEAIAGLPPAKLIWSIARPDTSTFDVVRDLPEQEIKEGEDCRPKVIQQVSLTVTKQISGAIFRCRVESSLSSEDTSSLYDDVMVKIPDPIIPSEAPYVLTCQGEQCPSDPPIKDDLTNSAIHIFPSLISTVFVLTFIYRLL